VPAMETFYEAIKIGIGHLNNLRKGDTSWV